MTFYKPELIADSSGKWCGNSLRFATLDHARTVLLSAVMQITLIEDELRELERARAALIAGSRTDLPAHCLPRARAGFR